MGDFTSTIRKEVARKNYILSRHARTQKGWRKIRDKEIVETILKGEVVEKNPRAVPHPKALFMHPTRSGEPLYVACAYDGERARIITVHWFDPKKWINPRTRRK